MVAGATASAAASVVSHPLDTVRVRIQLHEGSNVKLLPTIKDIYKHEGLRGFFKGLISPIVGRVPVAAIMYTSQGYSKRALDKSNLSTNMKNFISGFIAGICFANSFFVFDMFKTRAQMRKDSNISYKHEIMTILKTEGLRGFTRGW